MLAAGAAALGLPALASAGSGGAGAGPGTSSNPDVRPGNVTVTATSNGITIAAGASAFMRTGLSVTGSAPAGDAGRSIEIDQLGSSSGSAWTPVAVASVQAGGTFTAAWQTSHAGPVTIRASLQGTQPPSAASSPPAVSVIVYRRSIATLYGPGFYGHRTACGTILRRRTIGVANRTLPCGTLIQVYYRGSVMTVPVIDRGPYAHGANWDLTMATGRALGMTGTARIGAAAMPPAATTIPVAAPPAGGAAPAQ